MSPLPTQLRDRWLDRSEPDVGSGTLYWHVLLARYPEASQAAAAAQAALADFPGFHMTPSSWIHMTVFLAGPAEEFTRDQMAEMVKIAADDLRETKPIEVDLGRVLYHPEAVMLAAEPADKLRPIRAAARRATAVAIGQEAPAKEPASAWTPHMTVSYSTAAQPAEPVIAALGKRVPTQRIAIDKLDLVVQWGPERLWDWETIGTVEL
jgi:2'-5' RNA ligase